MQYQGQKKHKEKMEGTKHERAYQEMMEANGDNTCTVQRLQAYHQPQQPMLLNTTHAMQHPTS